jgi:hypothetical protein
MLTDYRNWLESELKLLGNASHHAYSFGQANMAKRAIERLDQEFSDSIVVAFTREEAAAILTGLEMLTEQTSSPAPEFALLRERLTIGFSEAGGADRNLYHE